MLVARVRGAVPVPNRALADQIGRVVYDVLARYFAGSLLLAFLHGVVVAVSGVIFGIPLTPVLAVWAAITSLIPQVGGFLGFVVIVVVSLTQGVKPAIGMGVIFFAYMTLSNNVLEPLVVGRAVRLSPAVTMVAALAGFSVAGVVGSLLAVPTIGAIKAVATYLRHRDDPDYEGPGSDVAPPGGTVGERLKALVPRWGHARARAQ
jgi:putative heme transporter